jgi:hypothetical protein
MENKRMPTHNEITRRLFPPAVTTPEKESPSGELAPVLSQILGELREIRGKLAGAPKPLLTIEEVAELTGRSAITVRRWSRKAASTPPGSAELAHAVDCSSAGSNSRS